MSPSRDGERRLGLSFAVLPDPARLRDARETVREHVARYCTDGSIVGDVVLAIEEACSNAMRHGGSREAIDVSLCFDGDGLRISVRDHGRGFDVDAFDPDRVPDAGADCGRGLFLISRLCDEMELRCNGGTEVRFFKRVPDGAASTLAHAHAAGADDAAARLPEPGRRLADGVTPDATQAALETSRRRAELLAWTASSLLATDDPQGLVEELCARVMAELDCQAFFNFLADPEAGRLHLNACAGIPDEEAHAIEWLDYGVAVCGCAARDAERIVAEEIPTTCDPRTDLVASYGITAYAAHPLMIEGRVLGTLSFGTRSRPRFSDDDLALMKAVADHVAIAISHRQADEEHRRLLAVSQRQTEVLQAQSAELRARADELNRRDRLNTALTEIDTLIHSTLRSDEIMRRVVAAAVAAVGCDSAMVALRHGDDWVAEYGYPEVPGVIHERVRSDEAPFMMLAVGERRPVAIDDCERDPRCIPAVQRRFGVRSVMCLPLIGRGEALGVIFFNHHRAAVPFEGPTVDFAGKLALAISLALENARLYQEQQHIATTLQANFIHRLPQVAGVELGEVAQAAFEPERIGGDFSDAFLLPDGSIAILIGDVAGKGVRAAGLTETVRSTVRAFATIDAAPAFVLRKTSEALLRYAPHEPHVTAFFGVLEQRSGLLLGTSAGHPAPIHLSPASCRPLDVTYGPPLGTFAHDYGTTRTTLTSADYLVLYTDGALEARRGVEQFGEERLLETVAALRGGSAQELADGVLAAVIGFAGRLQDDLQLVTLRLG